MIPIPTPDELPRLRRKNQWLAMGILACSLVPLVNLLVVQLARMVLPPASLLPVVLGLVTAVSQLGFGGVVLIQALRMAGTVRVAAEPVVPVRIPGGLILGTMVLGMGTGMWSMGWVVAVLLLGLPLWLGVVLPLLPVGLVLGIGVAMTERTWRVRRDLKRGRFARGLRRAERWRWLLALEGSVLWSELLLQSGDLASAGTKIEAALAAGAMKPLAIRYLMLLVAVRQEEGRSADAEIAARKAVSLLPHLPSTNALLAEVQLEGGSDPGDALARLGYAADAERRSFSSIIDRATLPRIAATYAWALARAGRPDEARRALDGLALPTEPVWRAEVLYRCALAFEALGDGAAARAARDEGAALPGRGGRLCAVP